MQARRNLPQAIQARCARVRFGTCLCGQAARSGEPVFCDRAGPAQHEHTYEGMQPHGHYCIPIKLGDQTLCVIVLYLSVGHRRDETEVELLTATADVVAGIVAQHRLAEQLLHSQKIDAVG